MNGAQRAQVRMLPDGRRLHLQDGPIDLIVEAAGAPAAVAAAYRAAAARFCLVLDESAGNSRSYARPRRLRRVPSAALSRGGWRRRSRRTRRTPSSRRWPPSRAPSPTKSSPPSAARRARPSPGSPSTTAATSRFGLRRARRRPSVW